MKCRHCYSKLKDVFIDLVNCPPSNAMLNKNQLEKPERFLPLKIYVCNNCRLVSVGTIANTNRIFNNKYTYFSSYSESWLRHAKKYVEEMIDRFQLKKETKIVEIASNDGYLLQYFKEKGFDVLGIDPAANTAQVAIDRGINTIVDYFGSDFVDNHLISNNIKGDLIIGNNVLAHVPNINDFVLGLKKALSTQGIITIEFPHLLKLVQNCEFDTIYHEHYSYLSFYTVKRIFSQFGLEMFDVEELPTHGGSLRIFAKHNEDDSKEISENVNRMMIKEEKAGIDSDEFYQNFAEKVIQIKDDFLNFLLNCHFEKKKVIGYGAAAKGNTLLNYCRIKGDDLIQFVVDASPYKQNKFLPGSHIQVFSPDKITEYKPDFIVILPWNLKEEIIENLQYVKEWGCEFVTAIPRLNVFQELKEGETLSESHIPLC